MEKPDSQHNRKEFSFRFFDYLFKFYSDASVFSKDHVDLGTITLLEYVKNLNLDNIKCLDLGCGYGVVSIILKKLAPTSLMTGVDINSRALNLAIENALVNGVDIDFKINNGLAGLDQYDYIITNPPIRAGKKVIYSWFEMATSYLLDGGCLIFVMRKEHGLKSAVKFCLQFYSSVDIVYKYKGFFVVLAKK